MPEVIAVYDCFKAFLCDRESINHTDIVWIFYGLKAFSILLFKLSAWITSFDLIYCQFIQWTHLFCDSGWIRLLSIDPKVQILIFISKTWSSYFMMKTSFLILIFMPNIKTYFIDKTYFLPSRAQFSIIHLLTILF